jgi:hypothetical protein
MSTKPLSRADIIKGVKILLNESPKMSIKKLAGQLGVSVSTARKYIIEAGSTEPEVKFIVVYGNVYQGCHFFGPYESMEEAESAAEKAGFIDPTAWLLAELNCLDTTGR